MYTWCSTVLNVSPITALCLMHFALWWCFLIRVFFISGLHEKHEAEQVSLRPSRISPVQSQHWQQNNWNASDLNAIYFSWSFPVLSPCFSWWITWISGLMAEGRPWNKIIIWPNDWRILSRICCWNKNIWGSKAGSDSKVFFHGARFYYLPLLKASIGLPSEWINSLRLIRRFFFPFSVKFGIRLWNCY